MFLRPKRVCFVEKHGKQASLLKFCQGCGIHGVGSSPWVLISTWGVSPPPFGYRWSIGAAPESRTLSASGGHFVPQKAADLNFIAAFLQEMQPAMAVGAPSERGDRVASADAEEASAAAARSVGGFEELRQALRRYLAPSVALNMDGNGKTERWTGYEAAELEAPGPGTYERWGWVTASSSKPSKLRTKFIKVLYNYKHSLLSQIVYNSMRLNS